VREAEGDFVDVDQVIDYGVEGESGRGVDFEFCADVAPVRGDGVDGDAEFVGDYLAGLAQGYAAHYLALALAELHGAGVGRRLLGVGR